MKSILCPICRKKTEPELLGLEAYRHCQHCQMGWLKKFPKTKYKNTYYKGTSNISSFIFSYIAAFFYFLRKQYSGKKLIELWIDIGAGDGGFLKAVNAKEKIGVEISLSGRKIMKTKGLNVLSDKEFLKKSDLNADCISYWHVLEHVEAPWIYLRAGERNLSKEGKIIIGIPNINSFDFHYFRSCWFHLAPKYHLWQFSPKAIELLLSRSGFMVDSIDYWSLEHHITGILQSFINKTAGSDSVLHGLVKRGLDYSPGFKDIFWSVFWLTFGFPIVFFFWLINSVSKKSGAIVVVARKADYSR